MRIGIDATASGIAGGERGGVYQYILHLVRHVATALPDSELELMFALPHYRHSGTIRQFIAGLGCPNVISRRCLLPAHYLRRWRIPVDLFLGKIDVFHAPGYLGLRCRATPVVVTVHDLAYRRDLGDATTLGELAPDALRWWRMRRAFFAEITERMEESIREARLVIAVSRTVRDDLVAELGVAPEKVRVVHHGVREDLQRIEPVACGAITAAYRLNAPFWLYVGGLDPNKNLLTLLEGHARYRQRGGKGVLAIAGEPMTYGGVLRQNATKLGLGDAVLFLGYVPDAHLPALYSAAAGVVMPSPLEGFGMPVLEAMACGTPVIAANAGALPEVVGDAGLLVQAFEAQQFAEAMQRLDEDRVLREDLTAAGMRRVAQFSWERAARETLGVYAEASGRPQ